MLGVSINDLIDLTKTTLNDLPKMKFQWALKYQNYPVMNQWFKEDKMQISSGTAITRNIVLSTTGNAKHVQLYQKTPINVADVHQQLKVDWCHFQTHWSIERREAMMNRNPAAYIDLLTTRRIDAMQDLADLLEARAWLAPINSTDLLNPRGIDYWMSKLMPSNATGYDSTIDIDESFAGRRVIFGDTTSTYTDKAGISPTTQKRWRNYCATYTDINADFVNRMRKAFHLCNFVAPMDVKGLDEGPASKYRIYMRVAELVKYENMVTSANDNIGADMDKFNGITTFKRVPIVHAPAKDDDTSQPVFGINHNQFQPVVLSGDWLREDGPFSDQEQHNVMTTFVDGTYNFISQNVRTQGFVLHLALAS